LNISDIIPEDIAGSEHHKNSLTNLVEYVILYPQQKFEPFSVLMQSYEERRWCTMFDSSYL